MAFQPSAFSEAEPRPGLKTKLAGGWRRLTGKAPAGASRWDQTAVFFGAAGGSVIPFDSILWRSLFGALVGLLAGVALWLVLMAYFWLRAPYKQRDEARAMIRGANDLRNLVYARDFLSRTLEANTRIIETSRSNIGADPSRRMMTRGFGSRTKRRGGSSRCSASRISCPRLSSTSSS